MFLDLRGTALDWFLIYVTLIELQEVHFIFMLILNIQKYSELPF